MHEFALENIAIYEEDSEAATTTFHFQSIKLACEVYSADCNRAEQKKWDVTLSPEKKMKIAGKLMIN